jgi:hypothetical protein
MLGATGTIPPGKLVIPTGPKGQDQTGLPGDTGRPGDKGGPGDKGLKGIPGDPAMALPHGATQVNGTFIGEGRSDLTTFVVRASIPTAEVVYFAVPPAPDAPALTPAQQAAEDLKKVRVKLTSAGKYLFRITSSFATTGDSAIIYTGLYDVTNPTNNTSPRSGDNRFLPGSFTNSQSQVSGVNSPLTLSCIVETTSNYTTIEWRAFGQRCQIDPLFTTMSWVRIT